MVTSVGSFATGEPSMSHRMRVGIEVVLIALLALLALPERSRAREPQAPQSSVQDVGDLLEPIRAEQKVPGLAVLVLRGHQVIAQGAVGLRKAGSDERITINDLFHLASDEKAMTATLIGRLVEEDRLSWTTSLAEVFGDTVSKMD